MSHDLSHEPQIKQSCPKCIPGKQDESAPEKLMPKLFLPCEDCIDQYLALHENFRLAHDQLRIAREGLESISKNTCCESCQEAKLVAKSTLAKMGEVGK